MDQILKINKLQGCYIMLYGQTQKPNKNEKKSKKKKKPTVTKSLVIKPHVLPRKV